MRYRVTRKRVFVAIGITAFHVLAVATFAAYLDAMNDRVEGFCVSRADLKQYGTWYECALSDTSIVGSWLLWAKSLIVIFSGASVAMLIAWAGISFVASRRIASTGETASTADPSDPLRYMISLESAAIIFVWSLGLALVSGLLTLLSMIFFFGCAAIFAFARRLWNGPQARVASPRTTTG